MSTTTNYPSATPQNQPPKKDYKNLVIGLLAAGFLGTWGYLLWNNNKQEQVQTQQQAQISKVTDEKGQLQKNFDDALVRLDSLTGTNNKLTATVNEKDGQVANLKKQIRGLLSKNKLTKAEEEKAQDLIKQLNDKVSNLEQQVAQLTQGERRERVQAHAQGERERHGVERMLGRTAQGIDYPFAEARRDQGQERRKAEVDHV